MNSLSLVFAIHNHQPSGNFESVLEEAYRRSYLPFLEVMDRYPAIAFTQHWTGTLLEWLVRTHPECIERMRAMVERGQLELLGGGFYEPILAVIPEADRIGQIHKLTDLLGKVFGCAPRGAWLAERVWEPHLAGSLVRAGMEFVIVDDTHFRHAGLVDDQLFGYYVTEELGAVLKVFPIDKTLRYTIPFRAESETLEYLKKSATPDGTRMCVHADDGEKFGVWPKTYKHVYEDGWLDRFCQMLMAHGDLARTTHFGRLLDERPPAGKVYLPTASYAEMTKWVLDSGVALRLEEFEKKLKAQGSLEHVGMFVRGGYWRNFFAKYPESNHMHKKMLRVSEKAHKSAGQGGTRKAVLEALWAGQCNDPYWHGLFGGLYLPNLRFPVYRSLIAAETAIEHAGKSKTLTCECTDFDCDGHDEVVVESPVNDICLKPNIGGCLVELSYKPGTVNLLDILSRREEASHRKLLDAVHSGKVETGWEELLAKEKDLHTHLYFDWYRHASLLDHFFSEETSLESFAHCQYKEWGDFVNQPYQSSVERHREHVIIQLSRDGALWRDGVPHRVNVTKRIRITRKDAGFMAEYEVSNLDKTPLKTCFGVEFALGGMAGDAPDRYYTIADGPLTAGGGLPGTRRKLADKRLRSQGEEREVSVWSATDEWMQVISTWQVSDPATLWRFPVETVSLSESGFERLYQGSILLPFWRLSLAPEGAGGSRWSVRISQTLLVTNR